ncbi:MAG TPA: hypothetical protein VJQ83_05950 [Tepidiformaceae bacterium]|nr:hypothetical protein [Tepidiformaceae bacterium]
MTTGPQSQEQGRLNGPLLDECGEWIWEQLEDDGIQLAGELIDLILQTERELGVQALPLGQIATIVADEFRMRGITGQPHAIEAPLILAVLEWEDEFLGFAGIPRAES